jgi:hypothetical protein
VRRRAAALGLTLAALPAAPALADIGPFTGVGTGTVDRYHHMEDPGRGFYSDSKDIYKGRFVYSFRIDQNGSVRGRGHGVYQSATWHLEGQNEDKGMFNCDIPMTTSPNYVVDISGRAVDGNALLQFELIGAEERNEDHDCGAEYTGFATQSTFLANSLRDVQKDELSVNIERPRIAPLRLLEQTGIRATGA